MIKNINFKKIYIKKGRKSQECGCAITEPDYQHPPEDATSQSGNNAGPRNGGTGKMV